MDMLQERDLVIRLSRKYGTAGWALSPENPFGHPGIEADPPEDLTAAETVLTPVLTPDRLADDARNLHSEAQHRDSLRRVANLVTKFCLDCLTVLAGQPPQARQ
jgi:hypothetical protein